MALHIGSQKARDRAWSACRARSSACGARGGRSAPRSTCRASSGLPGGWPHLTLGEGWKLEAIDTSLGAQRPLAWIDDIHDVKEAAWAASREGPTLLVTTDPAVGLTDEHVTRLEAWANVNPGI